MLMISGTIKSAVKLDALLGKWEQKKENNDWKRDNTLTGEEKLICQFKDELATMRENKRAEEISAKVRNGQDLSPDEIAYLQRERPQVYRDYLEIKNEKEAYERKLKKCETKEEVDRLKVEQLSQYAAQAKKIMNNPNVPLSEKQACAMKILDKISAISEKEAEFKMSAAYRNLESEEDIRRREATESEIAEEITEELGEMEEDGEAAEGETEVPATSAENNLPSDTEGVVKLVAELWNAQRPVGGGAVYIDAGEFLSDMNKEKSEQ